jgi:hypothetical protein
VNKLGKILKVSLGRIIMENYIIAIKDILVIVVPIIVAYISYRSNKKTARDIHLELEKSLREKDADTTQMLAKINAELESQKQMSSWQNSLPRMDQYVDEIGDIRYGNIAGLTDLTQKVSYYIERNDLPLKELEDIHTMLLKIKLPIDEPELYPFEIPILIDFRKLLYKIEKMIEVPN